MLGWGERLRLCLYWVGEPRALQRNAGARGWLVCNGNGVSLGTASGVWEWVVGGSTVSIGMATDSTPRATVRHLGAETNDRLSAVLPPLPGTSPPRPTGRCHQIQNGLVRDEATHVDFLCRLRNSPGTQGLRPGLLGYNYRVVKQGKL